jgi:hypothetical protein
MTPADSGGAYGFTSLPPGKYRLAAVDDVDLAMGARGMNWEDYENFVENLDLQAGDKVIKDLKQRPSGGQ